MSVSRRWAVVSAIAGLLAFGTAAAKLPAPSEEAKAKAAEAKAKADEGAKKDAELLGKSQDRATDNYKKGQGKAVKTSATVKK